MLARRAPRPPGPKPGGPAGPAPMPAESPEHAAVVEYINR